MGGAKKPRHEKKTRPPRTKEEEEKFKEEIKAKMDKLFQEYRANQSGEKTRSVGSKYQDLFVEIGKMVSDEDDRV